MVMAINGHIPPCMGGGMGGAINYGNKYGGNFSYHLMAINGDATLLLSIRILESVFQALQHATCTVIT